nr:hypothetical protein [Pseudoflavonifractor sp. An44]
MFDSNIGWVPVRLEFLRIGY